MLIYSEHRSPRLDYMLDLISSEIFTEPFVHTSDKPAYLSYTGYKLNYSVERFSEGEFFLQPHPILFETGIRDQPVLRFDFSSRPAFFKTEGDYSFDIFAAAFFGYVTVPSCRLIAFVRMACAQSLQAPNDKLA